MKMPYYQIIAGNGVPGRRYQDKQRAIRAALSRNTRYGEKNRVALLERINDTCRMISDAWLPDRAV